MRILKTLLYLLSLSILTLTAGCPRDDEPAADGPSAADTGPAEAAPRATEAEIPATLACANSNAGDEFVEAAIRITLNSDGSLNQIEGKNDNGIWEGPRQQQTATPESRGDCIASIQLFSLNRDNPKELTAPNGDPAHSDTGVVNPPYTTHCHRWALIQGENTLVHCK
jgi:hypothetical protein